MVPGLGTGWAGVLLLLCQWPSYADSKCCEKKVVPGLSSKAGTYNLVSHSDPVPDFCLGGCVYTKQDDPQPGTNYCFREGDMNYTCSGRGCGGGGGCGGDMEGWIEKYFQKECSMQINSVLKVNVRKYFGYRPQCGWSDNDISDASVKLYDNPACEGAAVQEGWSRFYSEAVFLVKVTDTRSWSVFVSKAGFKSECRDIRMIVPFTTNYNSIYMTQNVSESVLISTVSLNFTFDISNELLTDVFVQGNPTDCLNYTYPFRSSAGKTKTKKKNVKQKSKSTSDYDFYAKKPEMVNRQGSGSGGGGVYNYKCSPTCRYASWNTDPSITPCACKGVIGGGLNFSDITLPNQQTPSGEASMSGSLFWYKEASFQVPFQFFTAFAEFSRRNNTSVRACDSNLSISLQSKTSPRAVQKTVPCFPPQIPPTTPMPNPAFPPVPFPGGSGFPGLPTHSPGISDGSLDSGLTPSPPTTPDSPGSGSGVRGTWPTSYPQWLTTTPDEDQFQFVDGVLIWGKGDGFWIVGCMAGDDIDTFLPLEVDFFTAKDPRDTPEFCGCLLSTMQMEHTEATREAVKECYVKALAGGPSPTNIGRKKKMTKKRGKKLQKHQERKWKNKDKKLQKRLRKLERLNRHQKTGKSMKNLKKFVRKMKAKQQKFKPGRSKRDVTDKELYEVDFAEEEFDENMFDEEVLSGDEISMDFGNTFDFDEYGDTYDVSEDYIEQDYEFEDDSLSSDW